MDLPNDWFALMLLVFMLGLKHGLDADHLATIDGLARFNVQASPRLSRWCGFLFSLGHGVVVVAIATGMGSVAATFQVPQWVEDLGAWISITFLLLLGIMNLAAVLSAPADRVVATVGLKGRIFVRFIRTGNPFVIALVGALFALSFDTLSQATLFALTGAQFGGWHHGLVLGLLFMLGMMATDGVNGLWISRILRRADQAAVIASRVMALVVSGLSLTVGAFGIAKYFSPAVEAWSEGRELALGASVMMAVALSFVCAPRLPRIRSAFPSVN